MKILLAVTFCLLVISCRVRKDIQTTRINTDSIVTHVSDSIYKKDSSHFELKIKNILDNTTSRIEFVTDTLPCPPINCDSSGL